MSLQTGGRAMGAISTRSRSASCARRSASAVGTMPTVSPLGPTRRTSETRIRSLIRSSVLMCPPDGFLAGGLCQSGTGPEINKGFRLLQAEASHDARSPQGLRIAGYDLWCARCAPGRDPGPDPTTCATPDAAGAAAVGAGGRTRGAWSPLVRSAPESCRGTDRELIGQHGMLA